MWPDALVVFVLVLYLLGGFLAFSMAVVDDLLDGWWLWLFVVTWPLMVAVIGIAYVVAIVVFAIDLPYLRRRKSV